MYIALKAPNYDLPECVMFTAKALANEYMQKWWEDEYNTALAKSTSEIVQTETYHEDEYAKITWADGARIEFFVVKDSRHQDWK